MKGSGRKSKATASKPEGWLAELEVKRGRVSGGQETRLSPALTLKFIETDTLIQCAKKEKKSGE